MAHHLAMGLVQAIRMQPVEHVVVEWIRNRHQPVDGGGDALPALLVKIGKLDISPFGGIGHERGFAAGTGKAHQAIAGKRTSQVQQLERFQQRRQ